MATVKADYSIFEFDIGVEVADGMQGQLKVEPKEIAAALTALGKVGDVFKAVLENRRKAQMRLIEDAGEALG